LQAICWRDAGASIIRGRSKSFDVGQGVPYVMPYRWMHVAEVDRHQWVLERNCALTPRARPMAGGLTGSKNEEWRGCAE